MNLILLSGGSGKRLWPLSNDSRSKQFLKILHNGQEPESMVQRVWRQLKQVNLAHSTIIATSKSQVEMIQSQLGSLVPLIIEPERRDTFPAVALAVSYLYSVKGVALDQVIAVLPVDPYVEEGFFKKVMALENVLNDSKASLALLGVKPTYPSEKYGYIVPEKKHEAGYYIEVSHFKEKPCEQEAQSLIEKNALWNCGVFAFKLGFFMELLKEKGLPTHYDQLIDQYQFLHKISFDYEVVEKTENIVALSYDGSWKDLGTWNTLTEEMSATIVGKGILCNDSTNTHIINELDIPVTVIGMNDAVIAASPDGILVTDKEKSPKIKELLTGLHQRLMYEERRWGWYKVLDYTKFEEANEVLTKRVCVKAGHNLSYQKHYCRSETWTIIKGMGEIALGNEIRPVQPGDVFVIPIEALHGIRAITDLEFIEVQSGSQLIEEDIIRIYMNWDEVQAHCMEVMV